MAHCVAEKDGIYRIEGRFGVFGAHAQVLDDAVAPLPGGPALASSFGWVRDASATPFAGDVYLVEFLEQNTFRIWGYVDRYGRAFVTDRPLSAPPARDPDVAFSFDEADGDAFGFGHYVRANAKTKHGEEACGSVHLRDKSGVREVARFRLKGNSFVLFDTWCNFDTHAADLSYDEALARCFFAFSFRPLISGNRIPERGLGEIMEQLDSGEPLEALPAVMECVRSAAVDPAMQPPSLALLLASWLDDAHAEDVLSSAQAGKTGMLPIRLIRAKRYSDTYYIGRGDTDSKVSDEQIWAIESAINRFALIARRCGEHAATASLDECGRIDAELIDGIAAQAPDPAHSADEHAPAPNKAGEWEVRQAIGRAIESFQLPMRFQADYRIDLREGRTAFEVVAPSAHLMPSRAYSPERGVWSDQNPDDRARRALRYAQQAGVMLACAAFGATSAMREVVVFARPLESPSAADETERASTFYRVTFTRDVLCAGMRSGEATVDVPLIFEKAAARYGEASGEFALDEEVSTSTRKLRESLPETGEFQLGAREKKAFAADTLRDVRIRADAQVRSVGERLSEVLVHTESTTEAIRAVQAEQNAADDPRVFDACTRLMTALIEDSVDAKDQNALVSFFIGEDPYLQALTQAQAVAQSDPHEAAAILRRVIAEVEASKRFADNSEAVHRMFDSYASRIIYNHERQGSAPWRRGLAFPHPDEGKRVELLPSSLAMCYLESVRLLEESFDHAEEAVRIGQRCIQVAPTYSPAYRQTARAYMLMGDNVSSSRMLKRCLEAAVQPNEIALAYYQLAYVEWRAGRPEAGIACYTKSMTTSPAYLAQCTIEMHQLMEETGQPAIGPEEVDAALAAAGIPIAPSDALLDVLDDAMRTAIDDNMFEMGQALLALHLAYRPDDALVDVHRSLNAPMSPQTLD